MRNETFGFIMPVYNEELILEDELRQLIEFLDRLPIDYEIFVVENGSTDSTRAILENLIEEFPRLNAFFIGNANVGRAKRYGLEETPHNKNFIVHVDFWDKDFIRDGIELLDEYPLVQSSKTLPESKDGRGTYRRILTVGYTFILNWLTGYDGTDTRGIKALRMDEVRPIMEKCQTERGMFESELVIRCQKESILITERPVTLEEKRSPRNFMIKKVLQNVVDLVKIAWIINRDY